MTLFVCAGSIETFDFAVPVGIGTVEAAARTALLCEARRPDRLIFVGTAGSYGGYKPFDIVESSAAAQVEIAALQAQAYTPLLPCVVYENGTFYRRSFDDVSRETMPIVNSSNYITTDAEAASRFKASGLAIENMEFFAIVHTAMMLGVAVKGIFVITNDCDADAHRDFIARHDEAMRRLHSYVIRRYFET